MFYIYIFRPCLRDIFSGLGASRGAAWHRTPANATLGSAVVTALNVSQPGPDKDVFELLNAEQIGSNPPSHQTHVNETLVVL